MIAAMTRLEFVCLSEVRDSLVAFLQRNGIVDLNRVPVEVKTDDGVEKSEFLSRVSIEGEALEQLTCFEDADRSLQEAIALLAEDPEAAAVQNAAGPIQAWSAAELRERVADWAAGLTRATREKARIQETIDILNHYLGILEQIAPALGNDVMLGKGSRALVLTGNVDQAVERLQSRFGEEVGAQCRFHHHRISRRSLVGLVTFPVDDADAVSRILSQEGVTPLDLREEEQEDASVAEVMTRVRATLQKHHVRLGEVTLEIKELSREAGATLIAARALVSDSLARLRAQRDFGESEMMTVIHGWVPSDQASFVERSLEIEFPGKVAVSVLDIKDVPHHEIPTQLRNPSLFRPFELVLRIFNPPTYGSFDPTILVGLSFTLFYGFIVGDVVYGLAIMAFALWLTNKFKHIPEMADVRKIGIYMGLSSMFFGVMFGEYSGDWMGIPPVWFHRGHEATRLLVYAMYMGIVHVVLALSLGVWQNWKHGHMKHFMEKLGSLLGLVALIMFVFGFFEVAPFDAAIFTPVCVIMFAVGVVLIFRAMGPMLGAVGVLEIMSLGGNVMSYARLMALGIAAIAIADIANQQPGSLGFFVGTIVAIGIHIMNILLSIASPTIHAMRLNVVEFLPKFYASEGRGYAPFKKESKS